MKLKCWRLFALVMAMIISAQSKAVDLRVEVEPVGFDSLTTGFLDWEKVGQIFASRLTPRLEEVESILGFSDQNRFLVTIEMILGNDYQIGTVAPGKFEIVTGVVPTSIQYRTSFLISDIAGSLENASLAQDRLFDRMYYSMVTRLFSSYIDKLGMRSRISGNPPLPGTYFVVGEPVYPDSEQRYLVAMNDYYEQTPFEGALHFAELSMRLAVMMIDRGLVKTELHLDQLSLSDERKTRLSQVLNLLSLRTYMSEDEKGFQQKAIQTVVLELRQAVDQALKLVPPRSGLETPDQLRKRLQTIYLIDSEKFLFDRLIHALDPETEVDQELSCINAID